MPSLLPNPTDAVEELQAFRDVKLIALDLDGTLLTSNLAEAPQTAIKLSRMLAHHSRQVQLTVATGRAFAGVQKILSQLNLEDVPIVIYNGSVVLIPSREMPVHQVNIPRWAVDHIVNSCMPEGATILAYYFPADRIWNSLQERVCGWSGQSRSYVEYNGLPIEWIARASSPEWGEPVSMLVDAHGDPALLHKVHQRLSGLPGISCTSSGYSYVEVRPYQSSKGRGLQVVAEYLGLSRQQVLAVGDNDNDVEMLNWAGIGVAVSTASEKAVTASTYICHRGVVEGVFEVMRLVRQAKRYYGTSSRLESTAPF